MRTSTKWALRIAFSQFEVTSICNPKSVTEPNDQPDPTDHLEDIDHFALFMRASKVPPRDEIIAATDEAKRGAKIFGHIGCSICHVATLTTAKAGTKVNGGQFTIPDALGEKTFHPYSDFLLHDVGTGDGIAIAIVEHYAVPAETIKVLYQSKQSAQVSFDDVDKIMNRLGFSYKAIHDGRNKIRTAPLWGKVPSVDSNGEEGPVQLFELPVRPNGLRLQSLKSSIKLILSSSSVP